MIDALDVLREMNHRGDRDVPADTPLKFLPPRWQRFAVTDKGIDRRFYEMAVLVELKDALRSGHVWAVGSRRFKVFDEYLLPRQVFAQQMADGLIDLPVPMDAKAYLDERLSVLRQLLDPVNLLAAAGELEDVQLDDKGLKISPIDDTTRRVTVGLNKGESRHKLARAVFFHRLGEVRDRAFDDQQNRASRLNLVMQAITVWNTVYIDQAVQELRKHRDIEDTLLTHTSPLGWSHILLTGDYDWGADKQLKPGEFRSLRPVPQQQTAQPPTGHDEPSAHRADDADAGRTDA